MDAPSLMQTYAQGPLHSSDRHSLTAAQQEEVKKELDQLVQKTGMRVPVRSFMYDQEYQWRFKGPPNYDLANLLFLKGKSMEHPKDSLEQVVEDLVKTWEFERSHKVNHEEHKSADVPNFSISHDGQQKYNCKEANDAGNYNVLLHGVDADLWKPDQSWHESHEHFKEAFAAFPWEVLKVFSAPPLVAFSWRHWCNFTGTYKGNQGFGQLINMVGFGTATVTEDLKLQEVQIFYKPEEFLEALEGKRSPASCDESLQGPMKPYLERFCPVTGKSGDCAAKA